MYLFDNFDFGSYDALSFMVSQKDKNYLIYEVRGMLYFIEEPDRCIEKRNQIDKELSQIFSNLEKRDFLNQDTTLVEKVLKIKYYINLIMVTKYN